MYPVMSVLRRSAAHFIYVTEDMLVEEGEGLHVRLQTPSSRLCLSTGTWSKPSDLVQVSELVAVSSSPSRVAVSMTVKENELADLARATSHLYTLIIGPEVEEIAEGVTRRCRLAVIRGVYRASKGRLVPSRPKEIKKASFGQAPRGMVKL